VRIALIVGPLILGLAPFPRAAALAGPLSPITIAQRLTSALGGGPQKLARVAQWAGVARLLNVLRGGDKALRRAAIAAAPYCPQSWHLLPDLLQLMKLQDRLTAIGAARAVRRICEQLETHQLWGNDTPPALLRQPARELMKIAANTEIAVEIRSLALLARAQLKQWVPLDSSDVDRYLTTPDSNVRRAAIELLAPPSVEDRKRLVQLMLGDASVDVALAAAATLCAEANRSKRTMQVVIGGLVDAEALPRLRSLALNSQAAPDQARDIADCFSGLRGRSDKRILKRLRRRSWRRRSAR